MWVLMLALTAHGGNLTIAESADAVGETNIVYGGSGQVVLAPGNSATFVKVGGWGRYGMSDTVDLHGKLFTTLVGNLDFGVSGGAKLQLMGNRNRSGAQMSVGGLLGMTLAGTSNPIQLQVPYTIGYRTSPDFAIYGRPFVEMDYYFGAGIVYGFGGAAGAELSGVVPLNFEVEYTQFGPVSFLGFTVGTNIKF